MTLRHIFGAVGLCAMVTLAGPGAAIAAPGATQSAPAAADFGPNVLVFDPGMPVSEIQAAVDQISSRQVSNEMGADRYALLFKPGTYGTPQAPLTFQVGYYTEVAGLGASPLDVTINGHVDVYNQCFAAGDGGQSCIALNNFWRSMSNLTINVAGLSGCQASAQFWAASQAAPLRRVNVNGNLSLMDYCTSPAFASGGFMADSKAGTVINGSQQQFLVRNSSLGTWSNGVWNQVFSGVNGAPAPCFPAQASCGGPYTTVPTTPVSREKPYLYVTGDGEYRVLVPDVRTESSGTTWESGMTPGRSIPLSDFFLARPSDSAKTINAQLARGKNLILTPGVYDIDRPISVKRGGTVVLGLGVATLTAQRGALVLDVGDVPGVDVAGLMIDAGTVNSPLLMRIGTPHSHRSDPRNPISLQDVYFRIGGPHAGNASVSLQVDSDDVLLDNIWAWRADHGNPGAFGWAVSTGASGLVVNGDNVSATGLFVEHYQKYEVIWNGNGGNVIFFQNELPYDPPSQAEWQHDGVKGWAALKVPTGVTRFQGRGMGSYSFFNQGVDIFADNAFEVPLTLRPGSLQNLLTVFLDPANGKGGTLNVVNGAGGPSTIANPSVPVTVVSHP